MRSFIRHSILSGLLLPALASAVTPINLVPGWNLVGNSDLTPIDVTTRLSDRTKITTVWKWNKADSKWVFYAPSMTSLALATYAQSKGYDVLTGIESKEGFWVNAAAAFVLTDPLTPPPPIGTPPVTLLAGDLAQGWNLMGSADKKTPSQLNAGLNSSLNAAGKAIVTAWAWDAPGANWRFYAPTLEAQGGTVLSAYITSKGYLPFTGVLASTDGFWLNIGAVTPVIVEPPTAGGNLHALTFTNASNWYLRVTSSTIAQNTLAEDGTLRYRELRTAQSTGGAPYSWGAGGSPKRGADLHWNGSSWANCPINFENTNSARDASGNNTHNYCDNLETGGSHRSANIDIAGRPMLDVYNEIRAAGHTNLTINSAATVLGTAIFPVDSVWYPKTTSPSTEAIAYYPGSGNYTYLPDVNVAAGDTTACNASPFPSGSPTATLAGLIAVNKGTPCVYGVNNVTGANGAVLSSGSRNEGWGNTTLSLGTIGTAPTYSSATSATSWYTTNRRLRVGFGSANVANYYGCQESWGGSSRNCDLLGSGTYAIQTLGDAQTLSFSGLPELASSLNYTTVFVERGGHVYYGYQSTPVVTNNARLNLAALNGLFSTLGLPAVDPNTPVTLSVASYAGSYNGTYSGADSGTFSTVIGPSGVTSCSGNSTSAGPLTCNFTLTPSASDTTTAAITLGVAENGGVFTGTINFYTGIVSGTWGVNGVPGGTFIGSRL